MRTGLIPNAHATVDAAATPTAAPPDGLRHALRLEARALDKIIEAARAGDVPRVLGAADVLAEAHGRVLTLSIDAITNPVAKEEAA